MSFCRFSSDDFQCDVYAYEGMLGVHIAVAKTRAVSDTPVPALPVPWHSAPAADLMAALAAQKAWLATAQRVQIGLPHDGESLVVGSCSEAAALLEQLRTDGYRVPQYAIDALLAESLVENSTE